MKKLIPIVSPRSNTKNLYQWEGMRAFFKSNDIDISILQGYEECTEVRKVNNAIKHNGVVTEEVKRISEFRSSSVLILVIWKGFT